MENQSFETTPADYLKNRVDDQIAYYSMKGRANKEWHTRIQTAIIVCGALIPLLIGYSESYTELKYVAAALGAIIAICQGVYSLKKYAETWRLYRQTAEALKREKFLFMNAVGEYQDKSAGFKAFVLKCEQIMSSENDEWKSNLEHMPPST